MSQDYIVHVDFTGCLGYPEAALDANGVKLEPGDKVVFADSKHKDVYTTCEPWYHKGEFKQVWLRCGNLSTRAPTCKLVKVQ